MSTAYESVIIMTLIFILIRALSILPWDHGVGNAFAPFLTIIARHDHAFP